MKFRKHRAELTECNQSGPAVHVLSWLASPSFEGGVSLADDLLVANGELVSSYTHRDPQDFKRVRALEDSYKDISDLDAKRYLLTDALLWLLGAKPEYFIVQEETIIFPAPQLDELLREAGAQYSVIRLLTGNATPLVERPDLLAPQKVLPAIEDSPRQTKNRSRDSRGRPTWNVPKQGSAKWPTFVDMMRRARPLGQKDYSMGELYWRTYAEGQVREDLKRRFNNPDAGIIYLGGSNGQCDYLVKDSFLAEWEKENKA